MQVILREETLKLNLDKNKIGVLRRELKELKKQHDNLYLEAIRKTLVAYDLVPSNKNGLPDMPSGETVHPLVSGRKVRWLVVYRDGEGRSIQDNDGEAHIYPDNRNAKGLTGADGVTVIVREFLTPGELAVILYHEKIHFEQYTTPGIGDKLSLAELEEKAYWNQLHNLENFGLTSQESKAFREQLLGVGDRSGLIQEYRLLAEQEKNKWFKKLNPFADGETPHVVAESPAEYDELKKESDAFDSALVEKEKVLRERNEKLRGAQRESESRLRRFLADLAIMSCRRPGSVTQEQIDQLPRPYDPNFYKTALPGGLDEDCSKSLYGTMCRILANRDRLTARDANPVLPAQADSPGFIPQAQRAKPAPRDKILWSYYFRLAELAREACEAHGNLASYAPLYQTGVPWDEIELRSDEMALAKEYSRQLNGCVGGVFLEIMAAVTGNRSGDVGNQWLKNKAAAIRESQRAKSHPASGGGSGPKDGPAPTYSGPSQSLPSWAPTVPNNW